MFIVSDKSIANRQHYTVPFDDLSFNLSKDVSKGLFGVNMFVILAAHVGDDFAHFQRDFAICSG